MTHISPLVVGIADSDYLTANTDSVSGWYEGQIKEVAYDC